MADNRTIVRMGGNVYVGPFPTPQVATVWAKEHGGQALNVLVSPEGWGDDE